MNGCRLYFRMIAISIKSQLQYRASFAMMTVGNLFTSFTDYLAIWALFSRFDAVRGWSLAEVSVVYGMGHIAFAISEAFVREFDRFGGIVRTGAFDRVLLRPRSTVLQMLGAQFQILRVGRLLQGAFVLASGLALLRPAFGAFQWAILLFSILGGALLFSGVIVLQATSCFWIVESLEVWNTITYGGLTAAQYPLSVYHKPIRYFFSFIVPLAIMSYWPCSYLLGKGYVPLALSLLSPMIGLVFFLLSLLVWRFGVLHYTSTGS